MEGVVGVVGVAGSWCWVLGVWGCDFFLDGCKLDDGWVCMGRVESCHIFF